MDRRRGRRGREQHDVVAFKAGEVGGEELAPRHDDDVEAGIGLVVRRNSSRTRRLARLRTTAPRACGWPRRRAANARVAPASRADEHGHEAAVPLRAVCVDVSRSRSAGGRARAAGVARSRGRSCAAGGSPGARPTRPSGACGPWRDGASGPGVRSWCSCVRGSRASCGGGGDWAEKCASWLTGWSVTRSSRRTRDEPADGRRRTSNCQQTRPRRRVVSSPLPMLRPRPRPWRRASAVRRAPSRFSTTVENTVENRGFQDCRAMKGLCAVWYLAYGERYLTALFDVFAV